MHYISGLTTPHGLFGKALPQMRCLQKVRGNNFTLNTGPVGLGCGKGREESLRHTLPSEPVPGMGRVSSGLGEVSTGPWRVSTVAGGFSPGSWRGSPGPAKVPTGSARVPPVAGGFSPGPGQVPPVSGGVSPVPGQVSPVAGGFSPGAGRSSPVGGRVSPVAGGFSPRALKTSISCNFRHKLAQKAPPGMICPVKSSKNRSTTTPRPESIQP